MANAKCFRHLYHEYVDNNKFVSILNLGFVLVGVLLH